MDKITKLQIYSLLVVITVPVAYLMSPAIISHFTFSSAWLAILASAIPGALLVYLYLYILKMSKRPFPLMLEDCFGTLIGKILGCLYVLIFLLSAAVTLRVFISFIASHIVPATPLSIFIGMMLFACFYALKNGLTAIARVTELIVPIGLFFTLVTLLLAMSHYFDFSKLLPVGYISYKNFTLGVAESFVLLGNMIIILTLAFFCEQRDKMAPLLFMLLLTYIFIIAITAVVTLIHFGASYTNLLAFPTFIVITVVTVGEFLQNIDVLFIAIWILGIFGSVSIKWFMACYITQQVFRLRDYRFLAAPTSVIIGTFTLMVASNVLEVVTVLSRIIPMIYGVFYIFIPLIMFIVLLFKPNHEAGELSRSTSPAS